MSVSPDFEQFKQAYETGRAQLVWSTLVADLETPVSAFIKLAADDPYSSLLESVEGGAIRGRYTFIGLKPDIIWRCFGNRAEINRRALTQAQDESTYESLPGDALDSLRRLFAESRIDLPQGMPPSAAGLIGYMGYDMVRLMENLPEPNEDALGLPDSIFVRPTIMVVFDNVTDELSIVTPVRPDNRLDAQTAYRRAVERLADIEAALEKPVPLRGRQIQFPGQPLPQAVSNTGKERYKDMVARAKEYIRAGDIFQVVLSQRFSTPFDLPPFALYRALRRTNPSPLSNGRSQNIVPHDL